MFVRWNQRRIFAICLLCKLGVGNGFGGHQKSLSVSLYLFLCVSFSLSGSVSVSLSLSISFSLHNPRQFMLQHLPWFQSDRQEEKAEPSEALGPPAQVVLSSMGKAPGLGVPVDGQRHVLRENRHVP